MTKHGRGQLIIIGGHEDKKGEPEILKRVASAVKRNSTLVILTVASQEPEALAKDYTDVFQELGVKEVDWLDIRAREDAHNEDYVSRVERASVVFFTGGDQLRITSQVADTPVYRTITKCIQQGLTVAGTSAGAAAMPSTMLISGASDESAHISALGMAPGLALLPGVVIDSHFAERGRIGRLLGAVAQNPAMLGIGIDENTAIVVDHQHQFEVIGMGAVYVLDGTTVTYSSMSEKQAEGILDIYDVKLHVLGKGSCFDLKTRRPLVSDTVEKAQ